MEMSLTIQDNEMMTPSAMITAQINGRFPGDHVRLAAVRDSLAMMCKDFLDSGFADTKYLSELTSGSDQKFWACVSEALVANCLRDKQFGPRKKFGEGPDFLVMDGARKIWIEVVCPEPVDVPVEWRKPPTNGQGVTFPHVEIMLRWTSAIRSKTEKLVGSDDGGQKGYLSSGIVAPEDVYVIAVNGCRLRNGAFDAFYGISQLPFVVEAVFPVGPYQLAIDKQTLIAIDCGHQHRSFVRKQNGSEVPLTMFLDPRFKAVSAVWAIDFNGVSAIGNLEPSAVVHNPFATNPLALGFLSADHEYTAVTRGVELILSTTNVTDEAKSCIPMRQQ
jgi:type I restriction enzyme S subunit